MASFRKRCRHPREGWDKCSCAWYADTYEDGRRVRLNLGANKREALRRFGELGTPSGEFSPVADRWFEAQGGLRDKTSTNYRGILERLKAHYGMTPVAAINAPAILTFEAGLWSQGYRAGTIKNYRRVATAILTFAHETGMRGPVPRMRGIKDPMVARVAHLSPPAAKDVLRAADEAHWFLYFTGLRAGELLGLQPDDVDHAHRVLHVRRQKTQHGIVTPPKTVHAERRVDLTEGAYKLVAERGGPFLFDVGYHTLLRGWHTALKASGQPRSGLHVLRHSNAALRIAAGQDLIYVAEQLGHASPGFTLRVYGHLIQRPGQAENLDRAWNELSG